MYQDELKHFGVPGMKWGVRKAKEVLSKAARSAGKFVRENAGPMLRVGSFAAIKAVGKIGSMTLSGIKRVSVKGREITVEKDFDKFLKKKMSEINTYTKLMAKASSRGNWDHKLKFGRGRLEAMREIREARKKFEQL